MNAQCQQAADRLATLLDGLPADQPATVAHLQVIVDLIGQVLVGVAGEVRMLTEYVQLIGATQTELAEAIRDEP